ncbi:hypothetical protein HYALB_00004364 [Hymenoscyphus albidus]|uniref:FAD/NAD(P)-binding domain-containing protein n=1 Tax=Hymenoscyphus albidus TaxID=595503 RepID=A0A9N9LIW5_9HELO|nr:hypothetical protein HYALB_00004364 [Hymenoscyphus albidus]
MGGSPAGLSAALFIDHRQPSDFRAAARKDFERYGSVIIENTRATAVKKLDDGLFEITGAAGQVWKGRKVVLATGVQDIFPDIKGYTKC